ncbi:MAG TPA: serine/threonine-protein kinase [Polyangia bacterium]|nr:serine/threonine-protein kinase [Polyangia bacterium]
MNQERQSTAVDDQDRPGEVRREQPVRLTRLCPLCGRRFKRGTSACPTDKTPLTRDDPGVADLGSYRLLECIGEGGMGAVYRAVQTKLNRSVAIKILRYQLAAESQLISRFLHEARAANIVCDPHVIEVFDFVETGQDIYFVMELLRGQDLYDAIHLPDRAPMTLDRSVAILEQVAAGLQAAHEHKIVHRDIKPENVFLAERPTTPDYVKIIDFGIAKLDRPDGRVTLEGAVLGTPEYMPPEQVRGRDVDARSDVYSLGCLAYEMLARRPVFRGQNAVDVLSMQLSQQPTSLRQLVPAVPDAVDKVVMSALSKDPRDRPPSARAFAEALTRAVGRGLSEPNPFTRTRSPAIRSSHGGLVLRASDHRSRRWKPLLTLAMTGIFLIGAIVLGNRGHGRSAPEHPPGADPRSAITVEADPAPPFHPTVVEPPPRRRHERLPGAPRRTPLSSRTETINPFAR